MGNALLKVLVCETPFSIYTTSSLQLHSGVKVVFLDEEGGDTLLFQLAKVIQVELFKHSSQRRSLAPIGGSELLGLSRRHTRGVGKYDGE